MRKHERIRKHLIEAAGWYGAGAIVLAYLLVSFEILGPKNLAFQLLNATGALGFIIETAEKHDSQPLVVNLIWLFVAVFAITRIVAGM